MDKCFYQSDSDRIQTYNRWSRNPVRYSIAPRSLFLASGANPFLKVAPRSLFITTNLKKIKGFYKLLGNLVVY